MDPVPTRGDAHGAWLFGYGSLIWRPDFAWQERRVARVDGWVRRFWQGSHDHRGVPGAPGRVTTLVADPAGHVTGVAYRVSPATLAEVLPALDRREQDGYRREHLLLRFLDHPAIPGAEAAATGIAWRAAPGNEAWLGPAPSAAIAAQIARAAGPSGRNRDYLVDLHGALAALAAADPHVCDLVAALRAHDAGSTGPADSAPHGLCQTCAASDPDRR